MSLPDPAPPRKLSRLGLYGPIVALVLLVTGFSAAWFWARGEAETRLDAGVAQLKRAGYDISWKDRKISGYPFRLNITLTEASARHSSGWALEAPVVEGQAFMHAPTSWVIAAPEGLTFVRPVAGPVRVSGKLLRASLTKLNARPPNLSFEGVNLAFQPTAGAQPFALASAERVEFHLRRAPKEVGAEAGLWLMVKNGKSQLSGLLGGVAGDKPVAVEWDGRVSAIDAFRGADWPDAVRNWVTAGGRMSVKRGGLTAGDALIGVNAGNLGVGSDGRVSGVLEVSLRQAPRALGVMGAAGVLTPDRVAAAAAVVTARTSGDLARLTLNFEAGQMTLGPVALAPSPKVYDRR
jgi:hypothetical protein